MPYVNVWVDDADLDEFEDDDLIQEIERHGYKVAGKGVEVDLDGIDRIEHLVSCGLRQEARDEALLMIEARIGRPNTLTQ